MDTHELSARILSLPPPSPNGFWSGKRLDVRQHIADGADVARFLTWPCIASTMFVGNAPYTGLELDALRESPEWDRYDAALGEDALGAPPLYDAWTSGNLIHQCYHLMQWERATGKRVETLDSIVEIGAGYGALCKIIRRLGFAGSYLIYDLPEMVALQEWYLGELGIQALWGVPGYPIETDLLIALWSLSEMSTDAQYDYVISLIPNHYLLAAHDAPWEGEDNGALFRTLGHFLTRQPIPHLPGNFYLLG